MSEYSPHRMGVIKRLVTDPHDMLQIHGAYYSTGAEGVARIEEHRAQGDGDKWYYDVIYDDGSVIREFHPANVWYESPEEQS